MIDNENEQFVCHECIGDDYLKSDIRRSGSVQTCSMCDSVRPAIAFGVLCDRVQKIVSEEFVRTPSEPENWTLYKEGNVDWEREGEPIDSILYEILESDQPLIEALKEELSDRHHSYDDALCGEEDPYGDDVHYILEKPDDAKFIDAWSTFESEIRTRARFFSSKAETTLDDIFGDLSSFQTRKRPIVREAGPKSETNVLYRARSASSHADITRIVENPARELGAPPSRLTGSGRMNPRWVRMFYGAFDPDTCIAEIRPPVGSYAVVGKFTIVRKLRLLDLGVLRELFVKEASFFDPKFRHLRDKARFLERLVTIMSRPVMPTDEDYEYLPTQVVAEYLSEKMEPRIDGLIYPSSQRDGISENVVLFRRAAAVKPDGSDGFDMETCFGWPSYDESDPDITIFLRKAKRSLGQDRERPIEHDDAVADCFENGQEWADIEEISTEEPALRVEMDTIEVRSVKAIEYKTEKGSVRRHVVDTDDLPF